MNERPTFNLIDEPWIEVLGTDGAVQELSIRQVLTAAPTTRRIAGELPTQDAAVLRLLLAILHRALPVEGDDEAVMEIWSTWWSQGELPMDLVDLYLDDWYDRFDLLDDEHPFFQVADLRTATGKTSGVSKLVADLPAGQQFFTNRAGEGARSLSMAEGARWLVHCQAFDSSGIKSGALGDERVKGGKGYPIGTGWSGNLGLVVLEGLNLAETLLLNLVLSKESPKDDLPPWETDGWTARATGQDSPRGPVQALTWQIRRIRLGIRDGLVDDALISNGDQIRVRNQHQVETMSAWRRSEAQEKKHREELAYMPREHDPGRAIWRGLDSLIAADPVGVGAARRDQRLEAANLSWVGSLRTQGHLDHDTRVTIHTVGISYGTQGASIETVISDRLTLRAEVVDSPELQDLAVRAAKLAEKGAYLVGRLASNLASAEGRAGEGERARATEIALQRLDPSFRSWATDLSSDGSGSQEARWSDITRSTVLMIGDELYAQASSAAIRGRVTTDRNGKSIRIDAAQAHRWFVRQVWADIPDLTDTVPSETEETYA